jgi:type II secretory pathway pseudopilin PulG
MRLLRSNGVVGRRCRAATGDGACKIILISENEGQADRQVCPTESAFSLVEVLLVVTLLSLIILALMNVFSSTQQAFRASVTQTDVLEGGRAAMQMIADDLRGLTPSAGRSNAFTGAINFYTVANTYAYTPLVQTLPASNGTRTNLLNYFFVLGRQNQKWTGVGYIVNTASTSGLYPLYRFYAETNTVNSPRSLYDNFASTVFNAQWTNMSHILDGVVHLVVRPHDPQGTWINNYFYNYTNAVNTDFLFPAYGEAQLYMFSNTVPAAVELQLGIIEDRTLQRAESIPNATAQANYLQNQSGHVHIFRQLVTVPNVDPSAYQ